MQLLRYTFPSQSSDYIDSRLGTLSYRKYRYVVVRLSPDRESGCRQHNGKGHHPPVTDCIMSHVESEMGCALPWARSKNDELAPCDFGLMKTTKKYHRIWRHLENLNNYRKRALTGCKIWCTFQWFWVLGEERSNQHIPPTFMNSTGMQFVDLTSVKEKVESRTETLIYGWMDLVAEVGGYMGLLLGANILSICDLVFNNKMC